MLTPTMVDQGGPTPVINIWFLGTKLGIPSRHSIDIRVHTDHK